MIDMIGGISAFSGLSGSKNTEMASAASMPQLTGVSGPASFAETMKTMGEDVVTNLRSAEGQSLAAVRGEVPTRDVVDAIMNAERTLQTAVTIRDKLVTSYLEIARMQI